MEIFDAVKKLPDELRTVLDDIEDALDRHSNAERAASANLNAIAASDVRIDQLETGWKELCAEAVTAEAMVATDSSLKSEVSKMTKAADKMAGELADERRANERRVAAAELINAQARSIDDTIPDLKKRLQVATDLYRKEILAATHERLIDACREIVPIIQAVAAINAVMPGGRLASDWLDCAKLISPVGYRADHFSGHVRVLGTDLLATDEPLPTLPVGAATAMQELITVSTALARHRKYQPPKVPTAEQPKRSEAQQRRFDEAVRENEERQRRFDEELAQREARSREPYQRKSMVREPGTPVPRSIGANSAPNAHFHDDGGTISDEWRRIGALPPDSANSGGA